ncbi:MAG: hypothetical protein K8F25_12360, partial [Fimbriimonadaceae bacterium]|nr:hypothetical protein [Alphaproteobacteria bacterium]
MKILVVDHGNVEHSVSTEPGMKVSEAVQKAGLFDFHTLEGTCSCPLCHVFVDAAWLDKLDRADTSESEVLKKLAVKNENSRLSCRIILSQSLDGLKLTLGQESQVSNWTEVEGLLLNRPAGDIEKSPTS